MAPLHNKHKNLDEDRTRLANQRTMLAYMRTALGVFVLSIFLFKFAPVVIGVPLGAVTIVFALLIVLYGMRSYKTVEHNINGR